MSASIGGEPSRRRQQEEEQQEGYDKSKYGPVAFADLDPEVQGILIAIKSDIKSLSTRAGGPAPGRGASEDEVTSYFTLAEETVQDIIEKAKQHPILTRALTEDRECLLQLLCFDFQVEYGHAYRFSYVAFLKPLKNKVLVSLVQQNPFSLLYHSTRDLNDHPIEEGDEENCIWTLLSSWGMHGPTRFVFDNPSLRWMFDHYSLQKSRGQLPSFGIVLESLENRDTGRAKQLITEIFPDGWVDSKDFRGSTLLHTVCTHSEIFDGEFNQWMMQENPNDQFSIQNEEGDTPLHEICNLVKEVPYEAFVGDLSRKKEAALTIKSIVERFPETAKIQGIWGDTPFMKLLSGIRRMYNVYDAVANECGDNHFQDHNRIIFGVAESMLQLVPQVASIGNEYDEVPLSTLRQLCHHRPVQDLVESIFRAAFPSLSYSPMNDFYVLLHQTQQKEASLAEAICDMKRRQLLLSKANKASSSWVGDEAVEFYRLWSEDRIRKLSASIKTIQEVEIPKVKERFSRP